MRWGWISLFFWPTIIIRTLSGNTNLNVEKRYFYHGDKHFMETPEVSNITFVTSFTVDFGLQYYLSTFEFRSTNMSERYYPIIFYYYTYIIYIVLTISNLHIT